MSAAQTRLDVSQTTFNSSGVHWSQCTVQAETMVVLTPSRLSSDLTLYAVFTPAQKTLISRWLFLYSSLKRRTPRLHPIGSVHVANDY